MSVSDPTSRTDLTGTFPSPWPCPPSAQGAPGRPDPPEPSGGRAHHGEGCRLGSRGEGRTAGPEGPAPASGVPARGPHSTSRVAQGSSPEPSGQGFGGSVTWAHSTPIAPLTCSSCGRRSGPGRPAERGTQARARRLISQDAPRAARLSGVRDLGPCGPASWAHVVCTPAVHAQGPPGTPAWTPQAAWRTCSLSGGLGLGRSRQGGEGSAGFSRDVNTPALLSCGWLDGTRLPALLELDGPSGAHSPARGACTRWDTGAGGDSGQEARSGF